ncbi:SCO3242 family prenyltransferase [Streptomyces sp. NPDC017979]|uniref:SCO3242 family prenyltransferase n=1 Tax=Streptomyces sp. NPDC017979 TaxID=3365024 RepID=UPI0037A65EEC
MSTPRDWAELARVSALFSVPGDVPAEAAASGARPGARTALATGASLCRYEAGTALNDWADRDEDDVERPHRPLPSGRIAPARALTAAAGLTVARVGLALAAGRPAALAATALAGTVWAYDLHLRQTPAGPAAMAAARGLDLLLGPVAGAGPRADVGSPARAARRALAPAAVLGAHTSVLTVVSRNETRGGSTGAPLAGLGTTAPLGTLTGCGRRPVQGPQVYARAALTGAYVATATVPYLHPALTPSSLPQKAVNGGICAMIPLQAALAARSGALACAALLTGLVPVARRLARKVSLT